MVGVISLPLYFMEKSYAHYRGLLPLNGVVFHTVLPEVGVALVKALPCPPILMLRESYQSLRDSRTCTV